MKAPNILFLMDDQHRPDVLGFAGNPVIRTPNLDALAKEAVVFENCYTPYPQCIPARQAMMAGQYPKNCGCQKFGDDLAPGYLTFARYLAEYAYATVACGKLHHTGQDQMQGWTQRIGNEMKSEKVIQRDPEAFVKYIPSRDAMRWPLVKEVKSAGIGKAYQVVSDEYTVLGAKNFILDYFNSVYYDKVRTQRPLLLKVSLTQPHYPYTAKEELFHYYLNRVPLYTDQVASAHPFLSQKQLVEGRDVSRREIQRCTAAYYAMVEQADSLFGQVLDSLRLVGQDLDDWIIIYASDHGEMLGEHSIWMKHKFYEASAGVPFFIRYPKRFRGQRIRENVNLVDIFATLCELVDLPIPEGLDSRSLVPLLEGNTAFWHQSYQNQTLSQYNGGFLMIKQGDLKYQYYGQDMPEVLFDLAVNPEETIDFSQDKSYQQRMADFRAERIRLGF
ncbi:hypothetical protein EII17_08170 [Clostridiales bacterium COT073_COT-073]|nr:hypothetical protein EII17_08170 [Clostridiales bacterium COT073_COT-073]